MYHFILLNHNLHTETCQRKQKIENYKIFILPNFPSRNYYITCSVGLLYENKKNGFILENLNIMHIINKSERKRYF